MPKNPELPAHFYDPETGELNASLVDLEEHVALMRAYLNPDGSENPDPTPLAPPIGYRKAPSLIENMRAMIREHAVAMALAGQEAETFEEADDFDVDDDFDPKSPWEGDFEPVASITADEARKNEEAKAKIKPVPEAPPAPAEQPPQGGTGAAAPPPKP